MANFTGEGCQTVKDAVSVAVLLILTLAGLFTETFIVAVNVTYWLNQRTMTAANQIITSLALTRIFLHIILIINFFFFQCFVKINEMVYLYFVICVTIGSSSIWLSALLSFFFCFKVSTFHNVFILRLKTIISQKVTSLIIVTVVLSFGYPVMLFFIFFLPCSGDTTEDYTSCRTQNELILNIGYALWRMFPLFMFVISSVLLIISLGFHLCKMKTRSNVMGNTGTYYKTIIYTVVSFLTCAFYITKDAIIFYNWEIYIPHFSYSIFLVLHSLSLIYVTTKLNNQFLQVIRCGAECLFIRRAPDPRVQVEMIQIG